MWATAAQQPRRGWLVTSGPVRTSLTVTGELVVDAFNPSSRRGDWWYAAAISLAWVFLLQLSQARIDLNLGDEGLLWYGVQRTLAGEWAIRDFQAYDPGRYLVLAAWARLVRSDGIVAMRCGLALIQWAGLFPATLLIGRVVDRRWVQLLACGVVAAWMGPRHKLPDTAAALWTTVALAALVAKPNLRRHAWAGCAVGLMWLVGMNHAAYAGVATVMVTAALAVVDRPGWRAATARGVTVAAGVVVGAMPMLLILSLVHGYASSYWREAILPLWRMGSTNLTLPVPWPWRPAVPLTATWAGSPAIATAFGFLCQLTVVTTAVATVAWRLLRHGRAGCPPLLLAAAATSVVWCHHAFARADLAHLAQASGPPLLAAIALPAALGTVGRRVTRWIGWPVAMMMTVLALPALVPRLNIEAQPTARPRWQAVGRERLWLTADTADQCQAAAAATASLRPGETALFVPYVPGLYAAGRLRCPMYDPYPLFTDPGDEQRRALAGMGGTRVVLYWPWRIDGRADLGFANTDPIIWDYVLRNFAPAPTPLPSGGVLYVRR
jgi:hypothetical protein